MGFELSRGTANKVKAVIARGLDTDGTGANGKGTGRHDLHVRITGPVAAGLYPCVPTYYDPVAGSWVEFDTQRAKPSNGGVLDLNRRYRAIGYGGSGGFLVFAVDEAATPGCGLAWDDSHRLAVDLEQVAGCGLTVEADDSDSDSCDRLAVDVDQLAGCGLAVESGDDCDRLAVDVQALAGDGLEVDDDSDPGTCDPLKVKAGCHIAVDASGVSVTPGTLAGGGLKAEADDSDGDACQQLAVDPACGLYIEEDGTLAIDAERIAGGGLIGLNIGEDRDCPTLFVDNQHFAYTDIPIVTAVTLSGGGCGVSQSVTRQTWRFWRNSYGMMTGVELVGTTATSSSVTIGCCCDSTSTHVGMMAEVPAEEPATITPAQQPELAIRRLDV